MTTGSLSQPSFCPSCGSLTRKVSSVVDEGTAIGSGFGSGYTYGNEHSYLTTITSSSVNQTTLARSLTPPGTKSVGSCAGGCGMAFVAFVVIAQIMGILFFLVFPVPMKGIALLESIAVILVCIFWYPGYVRREKQKVKIENERIERVWEIWDRLFYCDKCDLVIDRRDGSCSQRFGWLSWVDSKIPSA